MGNKGILGEETPEPFSVPTGGVTNYGGLMDLAVAQRFN